MIPLRDSNPTRVIPIVTVSLIAANLVVFVYQWTLPQSALEQFVLAYALRPVELTQGVDLPPVSNLPIYATLLTSMFLHGGWLHVLGNMLYLWIFGNNVEERFGHIRFLGLYVIWGIAAALTQIAVDPASRLPMLGASGAVAGVLGAYVVLFPLARIETLVALGIFWTTVRLPALIVIGLWIILQFLSGFLALEGVEGSGGVAYFAHIGGAVAGVAVGFVGRLLGRSNASGVTAGRWQ